MNELVRFALVAFFPRVGDVPGLDELGVDRKIEALRRESTLLLWVGVVGAAFLFQIAPIFTIYRPLPAVWLTPEQLDAHAHAIATYPVYIVRQTAVLLKLMGGMFWAESPEVRATVELPAYPADPGTRRTEAMIEAPARLPRAPVASLVQLGRREEARGRARTEAAVEEGKVV
ncbi:Hypothetical protein A7982_03594 [Minicystis rosea]|nr:Hypothetical protein A7982_03594 [Minicystis rosea]